MISDLRRDIKKAWRTVEKREKDAYDGVLGVPPKGLVSKRELKKFFSIREELLAEASHEELVARIKNNIETGASGMPEFTRNIPTDKERMFNERINFLTDIYYATSKGTEEEGLGFLHDPAIAKHLTEARKHDLDFAKGSPAAVKVNVKRKTEHEKQWVIWAEEEWRKDIRLSLKVVTKTVLQKAIDAGHKFNNKSYEYKTVYNALTGIKTRFKQKLKDTLEK